MWRSLVVVFLFTQIIFAQTEYEVLSNACLRQKNATDSVFTDNALSDSSCCNICKHCTTEDCCGYNSNTRYCYWCETGTCCGSVSDPDNLSCCPVGKECCLSCGNSTRPDGLVCVEEGTCTCSSSSNTCVGDVCCHNSDVCGDTCCETGICCDGVCCETGMCCDGKCCDEGDKCCYDTSYSDNYCCGESETCCGGSCCSSTQVCLTEYSWNTEMYCCNADVEFVPSSCSYDSDCPFWLQEDWTCCYGCCCPGNYTCDSKSRQCILDVRKNILGDALGIGLGYGLGFGLLFWILWCCLKRDSSHHSHKDLFKKMGKVSWLQWFLVIVRVVLYAVYPYTEDFKIAIAAVTTGFWVFMIGLLLKNTRYEQWLIIYLIMFTLNFILNLVCLFSEFLHIQMDPMFFVVLSATCVVVLIDTIWTVYFIIYIIKERSSSSSSQSQPLIQKRNHVECLDTFKPKSTVTPLSSIATEHSLITQHFYDAWQKGSSSDVNIHHILKLKHPRVSASYRAYKKKVESENEGQANVTQLFHATKLSTNCKIMTSHALCKNADCSVCGISRKGFKISHSGTNIKFARFGRGIYFAPNSSKANDYATDDIRAMFYCKVVLGNRYETEHDKKDLVAPPPSYHSVYGKVGARLNYPEVVVYTEDAVKPTHVIIYSVGGVV